MHRWRIAALLSLPLGGCGTINNLGDGPHVYGGVRSVGHYGEPMGNMASYCDLPFSFALDTGILPITTLAELSRWILGWPARSYRIYPVTELEHRTAVAKRDLSGLDMAVGLYRAWTGSYPSSDAGLKAIYRKSGEAEPGKWNGIYLSGDGPPMDPWGRPYIYRYPGIRNPKRYDLFSSGPDRTPDTSDDIEDK
jgi:type II secretion system protein G